MDQGKTTGRYSLVRIAVKGVILFLAISILFAFFDPLPGLGKISTYNVLFPGRVRLPYGENPDQAYNFSLYNLEAMFASHALSGTEKSPDEFRVLLVGDSSAWGYLLEPQNTLAGYLNSANLQMKDGRTVQAYNLGYPTMSLAKDLMLLSQAIRYQPDLIIWLATLESFPIVKQLDSPIVQNNPSVVRELIKQFSLNLDPDDSRFVGKDFLNSTLPGQRRALADYFRLQLYGMMWAATGIDQYYPSTFDPPQRDLEADESFHELLPPQLNPGDLSFDILAAGKSLAGDVPIIFVNEPIYISDGENSDIRYNFFYPRWAYDQYRQLFSEFCQQNELHCLDEWNLVSADEFTNSAIHMTPVGTRQLAEKLEDTLRSLDTP